MAKYNRRQIQKIQKRENTGAFGDKRKRFCEKYQQLQEQIKNQTYQSFLEQLEPCGESITCKKGCTYCCFQHVAASIAEGIVIVNYLYSNQKLLDRFLNNYEKWKHIARNISDEIDRKLLQAISTKSSLSPQLHLGRGIQYL